MDKNKIKKKSDVIYIFHGDYNLLSRVKRQVESISKYYYNVTLLNGFFNKEPQYNLNYAIVKRKIRSSNNPLVNFFFLLQFNLSLYRYVNVSDSIIICRELSVLISGVLIKIIRGGKLIYDSNELSVETYFGYKKIIWRLIEKISIKYCDAIIHANKHRRDHFKKTYDLNNPKIPNYIIENYSAFQNYNKQNINIKIKLVYFGALGERRDLETLIDAVLELREVELDLVGFGSNEYIDKLKNKINKYKKIRILPPINDDETGVLFENYQIGIALYPNIELNNWLCAPNKIWQYIQSGLASITTNNPTLIEIIETHKIGVCVEVINRDTIRDAITKIAKNKLWENITTDIRFVYSWNNIEKTFLSIIDKQNVRNNWNNKL